MLETHDLPIDTVRVPVKRQKTLEPSRVEALAEDILENGQTTPIRVRRDEKGYVLLEGLHRLEALKALGEETVRANIARPRQH
ncbi:MAG: ParB N-terminal domain-containing protein [Pseudomonadota bacterium]